MEERGRTVAIVSCTAAAAAQLSGGRRGHFPLFAIRCNADSSQGYVCVATGRIKDGTIKLWETCCPLMVLCIAIEPLNHCPDSHIEPLNPAQTFLLYSSLLQSCL